jgi:hypothetical protein
MTVMTMTKLSTSAALLYAKVRPDFSEKLCDAVDTCYRETVLLDESKYLSTVLLANKLRFRVLTIHTYCIAGDKVYGA